MTTSADPTAFQTVTPEGLAEALNDAPRGLIIVDFDETLWLRNSTEAFLSASRPAWLAAGLLRGLALLRPWRLIGGRKQTPVYRDWIRVLTIGTLMPWVWNSWRKTAPILGARHANTFLEGLIQEHSAGRVVILSNGFKRIIAPLQQGMALQEAELIASPLQRGAAWRKAGKRALAEAHLPKDALDHAVLITDHGDDADLLARVGTGLLCVWPHARYRPAFRRRRPPGTARS
ncbi:MAG: hypothetical protein AAGB10_21055 [Pseudomonadota bacterium]